MPGYKLIVKVPGPSGWEDRDVTQELSVDDIGGDMDKVAAQIAYYGSMAASAKSLAAKLEAEFKVWKARSIQEILRADPKLAEWKTKALIESRDEYRSFAVQIAEAHHNEESLWAVYNAFRAKVNVLQSRGAMARDEVGATGLHTLGKRTKS